MRLSSVLLLVAAVFVTGTKALSAVEDPTNTNLLGTKRSLRAHLTTNEEERGAAELKKLGKMIEMENVVAHGGFKIKELGKLDDLAKNPQYRTWLKEGEDPISIYKLLGFTGKGPAARTEPRYIEYLEFSKLWRAKKGTLAKKWFEIWKKGGW
jgi:hypothetical protein